MISERTCRGTVLTLSPPMEGTSICSSVDTCAAMAWPYLILRRSASAMGVGKADRLATGIYEALVTTAAGLTLAIPVLVVYQILCSRVDKLVDHMDDEAIDFLEYAAYGKGVSNQADPARAENAENA